MAAKQNYNPGYPQVPAPQGQVVFVNTTSAQPTAPPSQNTNESERYRVIAGKVTGSLQIVCGSLSMILSIVALYLSLGSEARLISKFIGYDYVYYDGPNSIVFSYVAWPFWGGLCVSQYKVNAFSVAVRCVGIILL